MKKVNITIAFEDERLDALEFSLKKENTNVQQRMEDALKALYEKSVPEPVREYLDSKELPTKEKPKRVPKPAAAKSTVPEAARSALAKPQPEPTRPEFSAVTPTKEVVKNG